MAATLRARTAVALTDTWREQAGADVAAALLAGPFARLDDVCGVLHAGPDVCSTSVGESGVGSVRVWQPTTQQTDMPERFEHLAVTMGRGWYVMPRFAETGNRYSSFFYEGALDGDALVVSYQIETATAGRFAGDTERGIVVCKQVAAGMTCTPKIAARRYSQSINTSAPDWPTSTVVELACTATYARGAVTIAPMAPPAEGESNDYWSMDAAQACASVAYGGTHAVAF